MGALLVRRSVYKIWRIYDNHGTTTGYRCSFRLLRNPCLDTFTEPEPAYRLLRVCSLRSHSRSPKQNRQSVTFTALYPRAVFLKTYELRFNLQCNASFFLYCSLNHFCKLYNITRGSRARFVYYNKRLMCIYCCTS